MLTREDLEAREYDILSPRAAKAAETRGRMFPEEKCAHRTEYQRDRDRIIHSKAFRRLIHKTQVFLTPEEGDHSRTRLTHTLEVAQISRTVAKILALNEDLTEAIALGHDLGHTPFGHSGEEVLNRIHPGGFVHNEQSLRIVDTIEETSRRRGLNLTYEVRDGILNHRGRVRPVTLEGQIVKICDRIAYINHDIDDATRGGIISMDDLPQDALEVLGFTHSDRINNLIVDLCTTSENSEYITLSDEAGRALNTLRQFMFSNVYGPAGVLENSDLARIDLVVTSLYKYYLEHPDEIRGVYREIMSEEGTHSAVRDWISGMTDRYALSEYSRLFE